MANMIRHGVTLISIGNGRRPGETEQFVSQLIENYKLNCRHVITNEAGASVYSASELAREELPDLDVTIRGKSNASPAASRILGRIGQNRSCSIGVASISMMPTKRPVVGLDRQTVTSVVNYVGVDLNTASAACSSTSPAHGVDSWEYRYLPKRKRSFKNRQEL